MEDGILTLPEVALLLKVAEKTMYTMAQRGQIPAFKVRGQWRFKASDLDQWIEHQKAKVCDEANKARLDELRVLQSPHSELTLCLSCPALGT